MDIKIYYEDTDCVGIVYFANYLKYFERAQTNFFEERGFTMKELLRRDIFFMVAYAEIEYRSPARYGDILNIETRTGDITKTTILFEHVITEKITRRVIVEGSTKVLCVDVEKKVKRMEENFIAAITGKFNL